jgi:hypothetical protein
MHIEGTDAAGTPVVRDSSFTFTGARSCAQVANDAANCLNGGEPLPTGFSGWARITASSAVAVVVQRGSYFGAFGTYPGISELAATNRIALPAVQHPGWFRIVPAGGGSANVRVRYFAADGAERSSQVAVNGVATVFQANALPGGWDGSAVLESDRPIAVVAFYDVGGAGVDRAFLYAGAPAP